MTRMAEIHTAKVGFHEVGIFEATLDPEDDQFLAGLRKWDDVEPIAYTRYGGLAGGMGTFMRTELPKGELDATRTCVVLRAGMVHDGTLFFSYEMNSAIAHCAVKLMEKYPKLKLCMYKTASAREEDGRVDLPIGRYPGQHEHMIMVLQEEP